MKILILLIALTGCADKLLTVNREINAHEYIEKKYDCRNFAEEKYKSLIKNGYNSKQMSFVITSYQSKPHVVLNVDNWILDNNYSNPYPAPRGMRGGMNYDTWSKWRNGSI